MIQLVARPHGFDLQPRVTEVTVLEGETLTRCSFRQNTIWVSKKKSIIQTNGVTLRYSSSDVCKLVSDAKCRENNVQS